MSKTDIINMNKWVSRKIKQEEKRNAIHKK